MTAGASNYSALYGIYSNYLQKWLSSEIKDIFCFGKKQGKDIDK